VVLWTDPPSPTRRRGLAYERRVGKWLQAQADSLGWTLHDHRWFQHNGRWLQPDFVLESPSGSLILVECKLTWLDCREQMQKYLRALEELGLSVVPLLACRNLTPSAPAPIQFEDANAWDVIHLWL
jgi:hypothetical protein